MVLWALIPLGALAVIIGGGVWWQSGAAPKKDAPARLDESNTHPSGEGPRATAIPSVVSTNDVRVTQPAVDPVVPWNAAVTAIFATDAARAARANSASDDLEAACVLLAGPPAGIAADALALQRNRLWPWLLTGRSPHASPPPTVTTLSPPPLPNDQGTPFQHVLPDPQVPGGWLGMTWQAIYRCDAERNWRLVHRFLAKDAGGIMGNLRVEPLCEPGLVLITAATTNGPGGLSRDGGATWTWLPWPEKSQTDHIVVLAPLGNGRLALSIGERNAKTTSLFIQNGAGWTALGPVQEAWTTIPLISGGFIVDHRGDRAAVRIWNADGWNQPAWDTNGVYWPSAKAGSSRTNPALLSDRCGLISSTGIVWVGAQCALLHSVDSPLLEKRAIDGVALVADPADARRLWGLFRGHGLWFSNDSGATWRRGIDHLANLSGRFLALRRTATGLTLVSDSWTLDDAPNHWSELGQPSAPSASATNHTSRSAEITKAMAQARSRNADARLAVSATPASVVLDAVNELRREQGSPRSRAIEQGLTEAALTGTMQDRVNWVRFLLACAGDPDDEKTMLLRASSSPGGMPSADVRLQGRLPITAADLATSHDAAYTLVLARLRGLSARVPSGSAGVIITNVDEADRLLRWLAACAPNDPVVQRLQGQLEVALALVLSEASSVVANDRLHEAFGDRHAELAAQTAAAIARCQASPSDQREVALMAQLAIAEAVDRDRRAQDPRRVERLSIAAELLDRMGKRPDQTAIAMDVLLLRTAAAWRSLLAGSEQDALTATRAVQGTFHANVPSRALRCTNLIERLCDAITARANEPASDAATCRRRLNWRREAVRLIELVPRFSGRKLRDLHVSLANALAWDLLTLPDRSVHDPAEALRLMNRAVERDGRQTASYLDNLALVLCRTNSRGGAVQTQEEALAKLGRNNDSERSAYQQRLTMYRALAATHNLPLPDDLFRDPSAILTTSDPVAPKTKLGADDF